MCAARHGHLDPTPETARPDTDNSRLVGAAGFAEEAFEGPEDTMFGVGVHRLVGDPPPIEPGRRLFTFVGYDVILDSTNGQP